MKFTKDMIDFATTNDANKFVEAVNGILAAKTAEAIGVMKTEVASNILPETGVREQVEIVMEGPLSDYKPKHVQGLYAYNHFQHPDGSFIQVSARKDNYVHQDSRGKRTEFGSFPELKAHIEKMSKVNA